MTLFGVQLKLEFLFDDELKLELLSDVLQVELEPIKAWSEVWFRGKRKPDNKTKFRKVNDVGEEMLDYEWANPSSVILDGSESVNGSDPNRHLHHHNGILDHYATTQVAFNNLLPPQPQQQQHSAFAQHFGQSQTQQAHQVHSLFDQSVFASASSYAPTTHHHNYSMLSLDPTIPGHHGLMLIPKSEDMCPPTDFATRIGLNLGGRTYFSSEDDFMNRLYRRSRPADHGQLNSPRCQAEGCHADLSQAKQYHRRHKVCEFHSKASTVIANGLTQRFCQQCSRLSHTRNYRRTLSPNTVSLSLNYANAPSSTTHGRRESLTFHLLAEFDNGKRSCRKRLADHNRRRRKSQQPSQENRSSQPRSETARNSSSDNVTKSLGESAGHSSSAVTVAVSPPRIGLDCFRPRQYQTTTSSGSSSSLFFSSG
ncbi:hypothetical protein ACLB2K_076985 [Fragaria x ananassa]